MQTKISSIGHVWPDFHPCRNSPKSGCRHSPNNPEHRNKVPPEVRITVYCFGILWVSLVWTVLRDSLS